MVYIKDVAHIQSTARETLYLSFAQYFSYIIRQTELLHRECSTHRDILHSHSVSSFIILHSVYISTDTDVVRSWVHSQRFGRCCTAAGRCFVRTSASSKRHCRIECHVQRISHWTMFLILHSLTWPELPAQRSPHMVRGAGGGGLHKSSHCHSLYQLEHKSCNWLWLSLLSLNCSLYVAYLQYMVI